MTTNETIKEHNRKTEEAMSGVTSSPSQNGKLGRRTLEMSQDQGKSSSEGPKQDSTEEGFSEPLIQAITARVRQQLLGESQSLLEAMKKAEHEKTDLGKGGFVQKQGPPGESNSDPSLGGGGFGQEARPPDEPHSKPTNGTGGLGQGENHQGGWDPDPSFAGIMEETIHLITARVRQAVLDELDPLLEAMQRAAQMEAQPGTGGFETKTSSMNREQTSYAEACDAKILEMQEQMEQTIEKRRQQLFARISAKSGL